MRRATLGVGAPWRSTDGLPVVIIGIVIGLAVLTSAQVAAAHELTPDQLREVRVDQRLGGEVPLDARFHDESGEPTTLGAYFGARPVLLTLNYFHCQNLCPLELEGLMSGLNGVPFLPGREFTLLSLDIDPREGAADAIQAKARALRGYDRPVGADGWHMLLGDQAAIDAVANAVGFHDVYDAQEDEYAHPMAVVALTPDGRVSRYLFGLDFSATDLRLALVEAAGGGIGSLLDRALLVCYHYDPLTGRYTPLVLDLLHWGGGVSVALLLGWFGWVWRSARREQGVSG